MPLQDFKIDTILNPVSSDAKVNELYTLISFHNESQYITFLDLSGRFLEPLCANLFLPSLVYTFGFTILYLLSSLSMLDLLTLYSLAISLVDLFVLLEIMSGIFSSFILALPLLYPEFLIWFRSTTPAECFTPKQLPAVLELLYTGFNVSNQYCSRCNKMFLSVTGSIIENSKLSIPHLLKSLCKNFEWCALFFKSLKCLFLRWVKLMVEPTYCLWLTKFSILYIAIIGLNYELYAAMLVYNYSYTPMRAKK